MLYIEIGNTTYKLARKDEKEEWQIHRYDHPEPLLSEIPIGSEILIAPVAEARSVEILPQLDERGIVQSIERKDFEKFLQGSYDTPETLGLDRILQLYALEKDGIVVSCGTAITVDGFCDSKPLWGAILPGFTMAAEGLSKRIPALPVVSADDLTGIPARSSLESIANGIFLGTLYAVQGLVEALAEEGGIAPSVPVTITGGAGEVLLDLWQDTREAELRPALLFEGMARKQQASEN